MSAMQPLLPAWVGLQEEAHERRENVTYALAEAVRRVVPSAIVDAERMDSVIKEAVQRILEPVFQLVDRLVSGREGEGEEALAASLVLPLEKDGSTAVEELEEQTIAAVQQDERLTEYQEERLRDLRLWDVAAEALGAGGSRNDLAHTVARIIRGSRPSGAALSHAQAAETQLDALTDCLTCGICQVLAAEPMTMGCGHSICSSCVTGLQRAGQPRCPMRCGSIRVDMRHVKVNGAQQRLCELIQRAAIQRGAGLDLAAAREELTCAACSFVLRNPVTVPSGQSFCQVCFDALKRTDQLGRFIIDDQSLKYTLQKQLGTNVALKGAAELLFKEACALPDEVRARRDLVQSRAAWP